MAVEEPAAGVCSADEQSCLAVPGPAQPLITCRWIRGWGQALPLPYLVPPRRADSGPGVTINPRSLAPCPLPPPRPAFTEVPQAPCHGQAEMALTFSSRPRLSTFMCHVVSFSEHPTKLAASILQKLSEARNSEVVQK